MCKKTRSRSLSYKLTSSGGLFIRKTLCILLFHKSRTSLAIIKKIKTNLILLNPGQTQTRMCIGKVGKDLNWDLLITQYLHL